ncbi:MAG: twin-arginine translocase subunit TatC [Bacillota bacterium]
MSRSNETGHQLTLLEHLAELRQRLIWAALSLVVGTAACYAFVGTLREIVRRPARDVTLVYLTPPEALVTDLKLAFMGGVALALPFIFYQVWAFVAPGLTRRERRLVWPGAVGSVLFFFTGAVFAYFVVLPFTVRFLIGFASPGLQPMFSYSRYVAFVVALELSFGLVFQLPLVIMLLAALGVVTPGALRRFRKVAIVLVFVVAALLTPPDVISQLIMAGPLLVLYEISIGLAWLVTRHRRLAQTAKTGGEHHE